MRIAGVRVDDISWEELIFEIGKAIEENKKITITYLNVHVWNMAKKHPEVNALLENADFVYCDGKGIQLGARILGKVIRNRYTGAFFIDDLARIMAEKGWTGFVVGGREGVAKMGCEILTEKYPGFACKGVHHGYINGMERKVVQMVNSHSPLILFTGMGTPQQEQFVLKYRKEINVPVVWCVGALFDYVAGVQKRAPEWMSEHGLEWFYRFISDPKRLWRRYIIGNSKFLIGVLSHRKRRSNS